MRYIVAKELGYFGSQYVKRPSDLFQEALALAFDKITNYSNTKNLDEVMSEVIMCYCYNIESWKIYFDLND